MREQGQGLIEYILILVLCAVVIIVILALIGPVFLAIFSPPAPTADVSKSTYDFTTACLRSTAEYLDATNNFIACLKLHGLVIREG